MIADFLMSKSSTSFRNCGSWVCKLKWHFAIINWLKWNFQSLRKKSPSFRKLSRDDRPNSRRRPNRLPWNRHFFVLRLSHQRRLDVATFDITDVTIRARRLAHEHQPKHRPHTSDNAENIKDPLPAPALSENARHRQWHHQSHVVSGECRHNHSGSLKRRRPLAPHLVETRICDTLKE